MSLDTLLDAMATTLKAELPELRTSELAGGRIDLAELQRRSVNLPGAFVACTATRDGLLQYGKFKCRGLFLVVLAVTSRAEGQPFKQDRAHAIVRLLSRALKVVAAADTWGSNEVEGTPDKVASMNPYSAAADKNNLSLFGITWEQDLALTNDGAPAVLPPLTELHTDWKMTESAQPKDAEDNIDTDGP